MNTDVLNREKITLAKEILGINDITVLYSVKRRLIGVFDTNQTGGDNTDRVLKAVAGKWRDSRSADKMVRDIYDTRTSKTDNDLINILNS